MTQMSATPSLPWHIGRNGHGVVAQWLIVIIVESADADRLLTALAATGCGATALPARRGLLRQEPLCVMAVASSREVPLVLAAARWTCARRLTYAADGGHTTLNIVLNPLAEEIGGATLFALPVRNTARWAIDDTARQTSPANRRIRMDNLGEMLEMTTSMHFDTAPTKLVLAVVPDRAADEALAALLDSHFGATTVGSTGGFLRRGNTTIISGVPADEAQRAAGLIRDACLATRAPDTSEQGIAFALDVAWQMRL